MSREFMDNYTEEGWEKKLLGKVAKMNELAPIKGWQFALEFAYGGARLVLRKDGSGANSHLGRRFYYDEEGEPDYHDMCEELDCTLEILRAIKRGEG